jgi:hypothetical protein
MDWKRLATRHLFTLALVSAFGVLFAAGCGATADDSKSAGSSEQTVSKQRFCNWYVGTYCEKLGSCARPDVYPVEQCKQGVDTCIDDEPDKKVATEDKLDPCLDDLNNLSCDSAERRVTPESCVIDDQSG